MMDSTDLMTDHIVHREKNPSGWGWKPVLYFRADKVIQILQERNAHLQEINTRVQALVDRQIARQTEATKVAEALLSWAQNEEMIDSSYTKHGKDCMAAVQLLLREVKP